MCGEAGREKRERAGHTLSIFSIIAILEGYPASAEERGKKNMNEYKNDNWQGSPEEIKRLINKAWASYVVTELIRVGVNRNLAHFYNSYISLRSL